MLICLKIIKLFAVNPPCQKALVTAFLPNAIKNCILILLPRPKLRHSYLRDADHPSVLHPRAFFQSHTFRSLLFPILAPQNRQHRRFSDPDTCSTNSAPPVRRWGISAGKNLLRSINRPKRSFCHRSGYAGAFDCGGREKCGSDQAFFGWSGY